MTTPASQRASWRIFTIYAVLVAAFAGYMVGALTAESVGHTTAWHQGYNQALTDTGGRP